MPGTRDDRVGVTIGGKYLIVRFLAEGGMGAVYEAQHLVIKRRFAVKFLRADLARRRDLLTRFKREAATTGALEGENIAAALDFGIATDGAPYIVLEYLDGIDLGALLARDGRLPVERAADLVIQACAGMQEAHAARVVHRDLKPRNLFVCRRRDGHDLLKILDFGVAKWLAPDANSQATRTGSMVGTPAYMSPEQARGETDIGALADVYALGVILYEMLVGRTPHRGDSFNAVMHNIATQPPMPLRAEGCEFAPELEAIVSRALSSDPAARQPSAAQLARELTPFARRHVWPEPSESTCGDEPSRRFADLAANSRSVPAPRQEPSDEAASPPRGHRRLVASSGIFLLAGLVVVLLVTGLPRSTPVPIDVSVARNDPSGATQVPDERRFEPVSGAPSAVPANQHAPAPPHVPSVSSPVTQAPTVRTDRPPGARSRASGAVPERSQPDAAPKRGHGVFGDVAAAFDTRNPYE
jgi:serine/threonine protein kinase